MPSSSVVINGGWREYEVGDSKMDEFLKWLDENAHLEGGRNPCPVVGDPEVTAELRDAAVTEVGKQVAKEVIEESRPPDFSRARFQKLAMEARAAAGYVVGGSWVRAYRALCDAADRLDAMCARTDQQEAQELAKTLKE